MYIQPSIQPFHRALYVSCIDCVSHALHFLHTAWYKKNYALHSRALLKGSRT